MTTISPNTRTFRVSSVVLMICVFVCGQQSHSQSGNEDCALASIRDAAAQVLAALQAKDGKRLASLVHPGKGVRFSPSGYVNLDEDIVMSRNQVETFWTDSGTYLWGYADGTGNPIRMSPAAYAERYILNRDFSNPSSINVNDDQALGTTRNNSAEVYPAATRVEYYIETGTDVPEGVNDWAALRLVFQPVDDSWLLIAIIHDEWSV